MIRWDDKQVEALRGYLAQELSYTRIGRKMGCKKGAVASAVRRHIYEIPDGRSIWSRKRIRKGSGRVPQIWNEHALTETWDERKARRQRENAAGQQA